MVYRRIHKTLRDVALRFVELMAIAAVSAALTALLVGAL